MNSFENSSAGKPLSKAPEYNPDLVTALQRDRGTTLSDETIALFKSILIDYLTERDTPHFRDVEGLTDAFAQLENGEKISSEARGAQILKDSLALLTQLYRCPSETFDQLEIAFFTD